VASIPRTHQVLQAIRSLGREVKLATKEANQSAAKRLARGDYAGAQSLIEVAKAISEFGNEVKAVHRRWKALRSAGRKLGKKRGDQTPLWEFYRPILQALVSLGGNATRKEIEAKLEETIGGSLKESDCITNSRGIPRWKIMVGRARKHMIAEGFVTGENLLRWKITAKGEQAAKSGVKAK
jgi:restriction system protein